MEPLLTKLSVLYRDVEYPLLPNLEGFSCSMSMPVLVDDNGWKTSSMVRIFSPISFVRVRPTVKDDLSRYIYELEACHAGDEPLTFAMEYADGLVKKIRVNAPKHLVVNVFSKDGGPTWEQIIIYPSAANGEPWEILPANASTP